MQKKFDALLVEGAGGLLSPLGENFDSGDLIAALDALPLIVAPNRLGAVNHVLLTLEALPRSAAARARMVLMSPPKRDAAAGANAKLLAGFFDAKRIFTLPWLGENFSAGEVLKNPRGAAGAARAGAGVIQFLRVSLTGALVKDWRNGWRFW